MEKWRDCRPEGVTHHNDEKQDPDPRQSEKRPDPHLSDVNPRPCLNALPPVQNFFFRVYSGHTGTGTLLGRL
jgi:hypothetical protein